MKLGVNIKPSTPWNPSKDKKLAFWLAFDTKQDVTDARLETWHNNVAGSEIQWAQEEPDNCPMKLAAGGIDFDATSNHYITGSQLTITGEFAIGIKFKVEDATASNDVLFGDITSNNNFIRLNDQNTIGMKISSTQKVFDLDTASEFTAGTTHVLVINRDSNDLISVWWNGTKQADQETQAGSLLLDGMGARAAVTNYFSGVIYVFRVKITPKITQ